jgi:hypothetical protein
MRGYARICAISGALAGVALTGFGPVLTTGLVATLTAGLAANADASDRNGRSNASVRGIRHRPDRWRRHFRPRPIPGFRSIDGSGNNLKDQDMGAAATRLRRLADSYYEDGVWKMAGSDRPSARAVSNGVAAQPGSMPCPSPLKQCQ